MCVCVRERERETDRQTDTNSQNGIDTVNTVGARCMGWVHFHKRRVTRGLRAWQLPYPTSFRPSAEIWLRLPWPEAILLLFELLQ